MPTIFAIDPGPKESAFLLWDGERVLASMGAVNNLALRDSGHFKTAEIVAIEMVQSFGMSVGQEVFETVFWVGRFYEQAATTPQLVYRKDVKMHLCHSMRAKDGNIRQALIDKYGPPGTKKAPGRTYGISGHLWSALAIADYVSSNGK